MTIYPGKERRERRSGQTSSALLSLLTAIFTLSSLLSASPSKELTLPMPHGEKMVFVPVCVNRFDDPSGSKKFILGDPSGGFKEHPVSLEVGGSFPVKIGATKMWCFYMGKYEVTRAQYYAISSPDKSPGSIDKKNWPVTNVSWFDALNFGDRYNQWLYAHHKEALPKYDNSYGFLRLPTEVEWEFAARGAAMVSSEFFRRKIPYPEEKLQEYEWFGGPTSSHYKLQPVGKLKANPIGLHDMLGNADEITMSLFKVEYNQGRTGGYVIKGNNYMTPKEKLRSAYRTEQPFYRIGRDGTPGHSKKTLGFRMVISAVVFSSRKTRQKLSSEWSGQQKKIKKTVTPDKSTRKIHREPSVKGTAQRSSSGDDLSFHYLETLLKGLGVRGEKRSIRDILESRHRGRIHGIYLWIKAAHEQAEFIQRTTLRHYACKFLMERAKGRKNSIEYQRSMKCAAECSRSLEGAIPAYLYAIERISGSSAKMIEKALDRYGRYLQHHHYRNHDKILNSIRSSIKLYKERGEADPLLWEKHILRER